MNTNLTEVERRLWSAADELRANSRLKASEYSTPVLGLIFLRYAEHRFTQAEKQISALPTTGRRRSADPKTEYQARGVFYLPEQARFRHLLNLPESENIGQAVNDAMKAIEAENTSLNGVLPKTYNRLDKNTLIELLRIMERIPMDIEGDAFGKVYEYFLGNFAMTEGQRGGEFFTPISLVKLIVEIIEPFQGRILDPACGSGGMFVQSAEFVQNHKKNGNGQISIYGIERVAETIRLCKMNLAVHGLEGEIKQANSYYDDPHKCWGKFDYVMANPPFNVDRADKERIKDDPRFPFGMPRVDNANYLWIQLFYSSLSEFGRAGFVMANSAADARASELEIRKGIIESRAVDVMVSISSNFFYTVTLPCTLWFFDKSKRHGERGDKVLFIDARHLYRQIDRAHREFKSGCISKHEIQERFPSLETIDGLLIESPIDRSYWDWNEALTDRQAVEALIKPTVDEHMNKALKIINDFYALNTYDLHDPTEFSALDSSAVAMIIRSYVLKRLDSEAWTKSDLNDEDIRKASLNAVQRFHTEYAKRTEDEQSRYLNEMLERFNREANKCLTDYLRDKGYLFDGKRQALQLDDGDLAHSMKTIYAADLQAVLNLWEQTKGTNHIKIIRDIVHSYRREEGAKPYEDVPGLCKVATIQEIEAQGWSLNPGRYVGVADRQADDFDFAERLEELNEELEVLNAEAHQLEERIAENVAMILEGTSKGNYSVDRHHWLTVPDVETLANQIQQAREQKG